MSDLPFGFSHGDDPERDKPKKDPDSGSGSDPFGFGGGGSEFDMSQLGEMFTRLGQMFSGAGGVMTGGKQSGPVNYDLARQLASSSIGFVAPVPEKTSAAIADAVHLAETWLDGATALPAGTTKAVAWTPSDWIDNTLDTWKRLCDPVAEQISTVWASALPEEAKSMAGPLLAMMSQMGGMAFGSQLGQALGKLSREVLTSTDIGLPLGPKGVAALMPEAVESLAEGLEQPRSEIMTFLAAREAAHHRLFSHVPWLASQLLSAVEAFAKGMKIDMSGIEDFARGLQSGVADRSLAMEQLLNQGIFEPKATPEQTAALERLETLLALIEGWVQTVVTDALGDRIPGTSALSETLRRRRATGGPAEQTFATLVGLGTAAAQAARGRGAVGAADAGRRLRRPRRGLAAPRPVAQRRGPRRARRLHRPDGRRRHQRHRQGASPTCRRIPTKARTSPRPDLAVSPVDNPQACAPLRGTVVA